MSTAAGSRPEPGAGIGYQARVRWQSRLFAGRSGPVLAICLGLLVLWYVAAVVMNAPFQHDLDRRAKRVPTTSEFVRETLSQPKPTLPAAHQVAADVFRTTFLVNPSKPSSLVFHAWVTLASALAGFVSGTLLGMLLAFGIVHARSLDRSLMPWIISSQTIPILAIAPMVVVVAFNLLTGRLDVPTDISRYVAKALISTYLSFFPVTVGMVKGLRSPEITHLDLMRTYNARPGTVFWKLRLPASVPFLFASMKVGVAASLVGAIVAELPTGAVAGIGARLLTGAYYSQTIQIWSALIAGSVVAALLVAAVGLADRLVRRRMGMVV